MAALFGGSLRLKHHLGNTQMLSILRIVVDATLVQLAKLEAHVFEEAAVDVVVQIRECNLFGGHWTHPILVTFEAWYGQFKRIDQIVTLWFDD